MNKTSFSEVAALWSADKRLYVKLSSYALYTTLTSKHILPWFEAHPAVNGENIQAFVNALSRDGLSASTIKNIVLILRMILRFGANLGAWPAADFKVRYPPESRPAQALPLLSRKDQQHLFRHLKSNLNPRNLGILLCLQSGLRIGEICALQWRDIDVRSGILHISKTLRRIYYRTGDERVYTLEIGLPKTGSSVRDVPLSAQMCRLLRPLKKCAHEDDYLVSGCSTPLEPRYYRSCFAVLLRTLGIAPVRFHALRHSFATRCIESGCDYKTVSSILGHSAISTTLDLYVHPGLSEKKKCLEKMLRINRLE